MKSVTELQQYFLELESQDRFSGVVYITQGRSEVFQSAHGYASRAWKAKNHMQIRFDSASITKLFTAVAVLQLIDQGMLSFDTPVIDALHLEGVSISKQVNVSHLLTHTSGIADDADEEAGESYAALWQTRPNYSVTETAHFLPQFVYKPANFPPGQGCRYCNVGYILLGLLIEQTSGMRYRDYVRQHVFARAGMLRCDFFRMDRVNEDLAEGSDPILDEEGCTIGWKKNIYSYPPVGSPDGGAHVTASDLDRFLRAVKAGKLLSPCLTEAFFTPQVHHKDKEGGSEKYGYGLEFFQDSTGKILYTGKPGINAGTSGILRHYPDIDLNVVLLSNMENGVWGPLREIHQAVSAGKLP